MDDPRPFDDRNVFQMIIDHGGPGIWVRRTTWGASCARIVAMGEVTKPAPYFGNPSVLMDVYSLAGELKDGLANLPAAGTYKTWRQIEAPEWAAQISLRDLDDPRIPPALDTLDKKRGKGAYDWREKRAAKTQSDKAEPPIERTYLDVTYARKDEAKKLGARWDPIERKWWIAQPLDDDVAENLKTLGFLA